MSELERAIRSVGATVEWPPTPTFALPRDLANARRSSAGRRRRTLVLAFAAAALLAVGIAFAVAPARSAILRFLGFGGVRIERVTTLPRAAERPLATSLGAPVSHSEAAQLLGEPARLPPGASGARLYSSGPVVSTLLETSGEPLLLSELRVDPGEFLLKKLALGSTHVEWVSVRRPNDAIWIAGARHVVVGPTAPPRLAGNVLLWQAGSITYRLEGRALRRNDALALARAVDAG